MRTNDSARTAWVRGAGIAALGVAGGALVAVVGAVACSSGGGGTPAPPGASLSCLAPGLAALNAACEPCLDQNCSAEIASYGSACSALVACECPGGKLVTPTSLDSGVCAAAQADLDACKAGAMPFEQCAQAHCSVACSPPPPAAMDCPDGSVPDVLHLTVTGYQQCPWFNGTFTLTKSVQLTQGWSSAAITTKTGQAYFVFTDDPKNFGLGIGASPGDQGDFSPALEETCGSFTASGGPSQAGNISQFCPAAEDLQMQWSIGP